MSKKKPVEFYSAADKLLDQQEFVESIEKAFVDIPDPRVLDHQSYPLVYLLTMILAAVIAGANAITQIHQYVHVKIDMFRRLLGIEQPPGYLVFWWLLVRLDPNKLQETFLHWMKELPAEVKERIIAIDGKRLNGASKQVVHLVSAWEIRTLIEITTRREVKGKISMERRYYISSLVMTAEKAMGIIRSHWGIENHLHWAMDVIFREDDCTVSTGNAAENFALFRRMAQSVLQAEAGGTRGISMRRRQAAWNDDYAVKLLGMVVSGGV